MLRAVGHPVAVNPDSELERIARAEGWRIMRFDKLGPSLKIGAAPLRSRWSAAAVGYAVARLRPERGRRRRLRPHVVQDR